MKQTILIFFQLLIIQISIAQNTEITGEIMDTNHNPLSYVNIGIRNKSIGTVSDEKGVYNLSLNKNVKESDTIIFSYIGYNTVHKSISELRKGKLILMTPKQNQLGEVTFKKKALKDKRLGRTNTGLGFMYWNFYSINEKEIDDRLSKELGMNIKLHKNCRLEYFNFAIGLNDFDKIKFRINIYKIENGIPKELLISENILFEVENKVTDWQKIDLNPYNIYLKEEIGEFLVSIQWLESKRKKSNTGKIFSIPASLSPFHKIYYKDKAMDNWQSQTGSLSFYLDAKCD